MCFRQIARIALLAVYLPAAISVGLLHSDDVPVCGTGSLRIHAASTTALRANDDGGVCLACLLAGGHLFHFEAKIPDLAVLKRIPLPTLPLPLQAIEKPHAARAPPTVFL